MFTKVLVPLDGSAVAEAVLPTVGAVMGPAPEIHLCRVVSVTPPIDPHIPYDPVALEDAARAEALHYLQHVRGRLDGSARVESVVRAGVAAEEIVEAAREVGAELIAMSTHGRSGVARLVLGSVADTVVRTAGLPVLLVRPDAAALRSKGQ